MGWGGGEEKERRTKRERLVLYPKSAPLCTWQRKVPPCLVQLEVVGVQKQFTLCLSSFFGPTRHPDLFYLDLIPLCLKIADHLQKALPRSFPLMSMGKINKPTLGQMVVEEQNWPLQNSYLFVIERLYLSIASNAGLSAIESNSRNKGCRGKKTSEGKNVHTHPENLRGPCVGGGGQHCWGGANQARGGRRGELTPQIQSHWPRRLPHPCCDFPQTML